MENSVVTCNESYVVRGINQSAADDLYSASAWLGNIQSLQAVCVCVCVLVWLCRQRNETLGPLVSWHCDITGV